MDVYPGAFEEVAELCDRDRADAFDPGDAAVCAYGLVADVDVQGGFG